jgi:hypothetical protein
MAPNLKRITLLSESLDILQVIRPKDALIQQTQTKQAEAEASANYWEWTADCESKVDLFSAAHIEANLVKAASITKSSSTVTLNNGDSTDYWAEQCHQDEQIMQVKSQPQHVIEAAAPISREAAANYWEWSHEKAAADEYWNGSEMKPARHGQAETDSNTYWQWSHATSASDVYWNEASVVPDENYWMWSPSQHTSSDLYWVMPSSVAAS